MVNLAQIGIGDWGKNHLRTFSGLDGCAVKVCCDKNSRALERIKDEYGEAIKCTADPDDVFSDKKIDAVIIATLPDTHAKLAIKAMKSGKHVFIEKPLATSVREGLAIKKVSGRYNKVCMVGHILLYHPAVRAMKEYIDSGDFGKIYYIYSTRVNLGKVRDEENALWSLTSHDISVVMYLMGAFPISVSATGAPYIREKIEDVVFVNLKFKNDVIAHTHASWLDPHKIRQFTVVGSKRMAVFDDIAASDKLKIYDKGVDMVAGKPSVTLRSGGVIVPKIEAIEPLKIECIEFLDCVINNRAPLASVDNGIEVLRILEAAQKSLERKGASVKISRRGN